MGKPVVICVDDEPTVLESLKTELRRILGDDCLVETAEGAQEALELLDDLQKEQQDIALVLADYIMPGVKGDELLQLIHQRSPSTLTIMISGQADLDGVGRAIRHARLYRFIAKPWAHEDLRLTILEAIHRFVQDRQLALQAAELRSLYAQLQALNTNLEAQVEERTAELSQKMQELEELSQLKDDFLHAVSHDLRTPIAGMLLVLRRLATQAGDPLPLARMILDRIIQGGERQLTLLESLLEVHYGDTIGIQLKCQPMNFPNWVQQVIHDLEPLLIQDQATLSIELSETLPLVPMDADQMRRVLENLISNALKHNPPGICMTLRAIAEADRIRVSVRDNGVGMSQAECDSLFERYRRGGMRARRSRGVGLGLYICRQIIAAHGGQIGAISQPQAGAEFWFTLPFVPGEMAA